VTRAVIRHDGCRTRACVQVGSLPEEPVAKPIECFNPKGCF
jgi:hypothetical protein